MSEAHRFQLSLGASALVHALALGLALGVRPAAFRPARAVIPIALVGMPGGGGGESGPAGPPEAVAPEPAAPPSPAERPVPAKPRARRPAVVARVAAPSRSPAAATSAAATGAGAVTGAGGGGGEGTGIGGGDGSGGDGSGGARVAYGANPLPSYPLVARRLGQEGLVLLDVLVAPDGSAADVQVRRSSGFPLLDQSAASTVRQRWRFVPARRGRTPVESRVTVPIRFRLESERG